MGGLPDILFVIDTNKEAIAVAEANTLHLPVVAILDSNSSPDGIAYPIPGNDDAMRAIHLYCDLVSSAVLDGLQAELAASGVDIGARAEPAVDRAARRGGRGNRRCRPRRRRYGDACRRSKRGELAAEAERGGGPRLSRSRQAAEGRADLSCRLATTGRRQTRG